MLMFRENFQSFLLEIKKKKRKNMGEIYTQFYFFSFHQTNPTECRMLE
jgi:hypothetical protein